MAQYVKVGGTWRSVDESSNCGSVKVGGVWKSATNGYVKVGGVWKEYCAPVVTTTTTTTTTTATTSTTPVTTTPVTTTPTVTYPYTEYGPCLPYAQCPSGTERLETTYSGPGVVSNAQYVCCPVTTTTPTPSVISVVLSKCPNSVCCCDRADVQWTSQYQNSYRVTDSTGYDSGVLYGATTFHAIGKVCGTTYSNLTATVTVWTSNNGTGPSSQGSDTKTLTMEACPSTTVTTTSTSVTSTLPVTTATSTSSSPSGPCPAGQTPIYGSVCTGFYSNDPIIGCGGEGACTFGFDYPVSCFIFCFSL